ncbi:hypothetical protein ACT4ML_02145 [Natrinema sp. LN54]|uniref:hypothetical protein n=1 Tax=Natrinema sp. LN54 TaxID=3458705 RepID=UPI004036B54B
MLVDAIAEIAQYWEAITAASALFISALSLLRDRKSRQMDMLHDVFRNIGDLNSQIANYNPNDRDDDQVKQDLTILKQEKFKEYDYLCFLINRKKTVERDVYELGGEDMMEFFKKYGDEMDENQYSDIGEVVERWETHPPTSTWNRLVLWWQKTKPD